MAVEFKFCPLFYETSEKHFRNEKVKKQFGQFMASKTANPLQPFGGKDYPFINDGFLAGFKHAGMTQDISLIYSISGRNPTLIYCYGFFTHAESGTGNDASIKRQKNLAQRMQGQKF